MGKIKSLAGDTVLYGVSTILGRLLNWLLMPFYVRTISQHDYGSVLVVYSLIAILLVVVTLGFETGFFRFVNEENNKKLLDTLSGTVLGFGVVLTGVFMLFSDFFCSLFEFESPDVLFYASLIVLVDSFNAIFFAQLRYYRRSLKYSFLRFFQVLLTVALNLFFLLYLNRHTFFGIDFSAVNSITYILIANLLGSLSSTFYFLPSIIRSGHSFDFALLKTVFVYCLPLVGMGFFGIANQNIEKILMLSLDTHDDVQAQIAIYGANYKIGILMAIFTQSFRLAFEPFFFKESKTSSKTDIYADVMKYFVYFGLIIYAVVLLFMPIVNTLLSPDYYCGNVVIPFILIAQLFFGVYYSLSMWYKAIDKTYYGILMSFVGLMVNVVCNVLLIPNFGYLGAAISTLVGYMVMMILSLYLGNKFYPINYPLKKLAIVTISVVAVVQAMKYVNENFVGNMWFLISFMTLVAIILFFARVENISISKVLNYARRRNKNN